MEDYQLNLGTSEKNGVTFVINYFEEMDCYNLTFTTTDFTEEADPAGTMQSFHTGNTFCCLELTLNKLHQLISSELFSEWSSDIIVMPTNKDYVIVDCLWYNVWNIDTEKVREDISLSLEKAEFKNDLRAIH